MQVRGAERIAILGPSGAGKSSLLKALSGDLPALHTSVFVNRKNFRSVSVQTLATQRAVLMQSHQMAFSLPVELVIGLGRTRAGCRFAATGICSSGCSSGGSWSFNATPVQQPFRW
jgi:ABC-type hemin transport system ATPase subunit